MDEGNNFQSGYDGIGSSQYRRPPSNIWLNVYADEDINSVTTQMESVGVGEQDVIRIDRGPESYCIDRKMLAKYRLKAKKRKIITAEDDEKEEGELKSDPEESDSCISSGGLSDDSKLRIRKQQSKRKFKKRKFCRNAEFHYGDVDDVDQFVGIVCSGLREMNKDLVARVVNAVGLSVSQDIYKKVLKIERNGGMMIKSGERRRTPGGVFFSLVQKHPKTASLDLKGIFTVHRKGIKRDGKVNNNVGNE